MVSERSEARAAEFVNTDHTGGTYSHNGMIDYPRFLISEMHLGKNPRPYEISKLESQLQDWCLLTMHRTKEVEIAKAIDELMTSRSIGGRTNRLPDYDMLDAMIASALKKLLDKHVRFRRRVSVEEQRAQKHDQFLRGRQIVYMIYEHFRATRVCEVVQGCVRSVQYTSTER